MRGTSSREPEVSILVPICNVERYLAECLDSLCGQTLREIEIVCIDDGSTDSSPSIIAEYAARDDRIRVVSKPNTGYGDSMNRGLAEARGRWVGICEPDDFCDWRMFEKLTAIGERLGCDMVKANYREHDGGRRCDALHEVFAGFAYGKAFSPRESPHIIYTDPTIWTGVYRRDMIEGNGISFSATPGASYQDASFAHQCWVAAGRVALARQGFYHYRVDNAASSSKSGDKVFAVCGEYDRSIAFVRERGGDDLRIFGPRLTVLRFGVYIWNYNRIDAGHHREFAERWMADIVRADDEGLVDASLMTPEYRALLEDVLLGPDAFCGKYPDSIPVPPLR